MPNFLRDNLSCILLQKKIDILAKHFFKAQELTITSEKRFFRLGRIFSYKFSYYLALITISDVFLRKYCQNHNSTKLKFLYVGLPFSKLQVAKSRTFRYHQRSKIIVMI